MDRFIRERTTPGISPYNVSDARDAMERYVDTVDPPELLVDFYPFFQDTPGPGQAGYANAVRDRLDWLVTDGYSHARAVSLGLREDGSVKPRIPLWCVVQVHNHSNLRNPTPEEIRAQVNLALAHGARGIYYYLYHSYIERNEDGTERRVYGLMDHDFRRTPRLDAVEALNTMLDALDDTFLELTSDAVFWGDRPAEFVEALSSNDDYFLGAFTHTDDTRYLMVVNTQCGTAGMRTTTVTLDAADLEEGDAYDYTLFDVYGNRRLSPGGSDAQPAFSVTLDPGGGTLYRVEPILPALARFGSSSYELIEGGEAVSGSGAGIRAEDPTQAARSVEVTVRLSSAPSERLEIPIVVTALTAEDTDEENYGVRDLSPSGGLVFTGGSASASFEIRARGDDDVEDETIVLSFGLLPAGVRAGAPSASTVTIHDTPNAPAGLTATPGHGEVTLRWDAPAPKNRGIRGWQYQERVTGGDFGEWKPMGLGGLTDQTVFKLTEHTVPDLPNGVKRIFRVRAYTRGYGVASASAEATPNRLLADAYRGAVLLRWTDPDRTDIASWQYRWREVPDRDRGIPGTSWSDWQTAGSGPSVRSQTVSGAAQRGGSTVSRCRWLTSGGETAEIGSVVEATPLASLPLPANEAPSQPSGPAAVSMDEGQTDTAADYTSTDPEGTAIQWSLTGADAGSLAISAQGRLTFQNPPDYEAPGDQDKDRIYQVNVVASDGALSSPPLPVTVTVEDVNEAPSQPSGPAAVSMEEGLTDTEADYTSTDPEGTAIQWSLTGDDAGSLAISAQGRLTFQDPPDYEAPGDQDEDRVYQVNVVASDGALSSLPLPVAVTVDNGPDPGVVTFSPDPPSVGQPVTASVADPDGGVTRHRNWNWSRVDAPRGARAPLSTTEEYTPTSQDVDYRLRVTVTYDDAQAPDQSATGTSEPVPPGPCELSLSGSTVESGELRRERHRGGGHLHGDALERLRPGRHADLVAGRHQSLGLPVSRLRVVEVAAFQHPAQPRGPEFLPGDRGGHRRVGVGEPAGDGERDRRPRGAVAAVGSGGGVDGGGAHGHGSGLHVDRPGGHGDPVVADRGRRRQSGDQQPRPVDVPESAGLRGSGGPGRGPGLPGERGGVGRGAVVAAVAGGGDGGPTSTSRGRWLSRCRARRRNRWWARPGSGPACRRR